MRRLPLAVGASVATVVALVVGLVYVTKSPAEPTVTVAASPTSPTAGGGTGGNSTSASAIPATSGSPAVAHCPAWGCVQQRRFEAAAALVEQTPGLGIVVRDRQTGVYWRAGTPDQLNWASSTPKLAMATSLLERSRAREITLDATARNQLALMLRDSDNNAADALWDRYGKEAFLPRFQQRYRMSSATFVGTFPRRWGFIKTTAEDLQRLMTYVLEKLHPADRDYVVGAMRDVGPVQRWGVWAAGPAQSPGVKDGWSIEDDPGGEHWCTSSVGFVGSGERYVVAVMYHEPRSGTLEGGVHRISDVVATAFGGVVPARVTVPPPD